MAQSTNYTAVMTNMEGREQVGWGNKPPLPFSFGYTCPSASNSSMHLEMGGGGGRENSFQKVICNTLVVEILEIYNQVLHRCNEDNS